MAEYVLCEECRASILSTTAVKYGGLCAPCARKTGNRRLSSRNRRKKSSINAMILKQLFAIQIMLGGFTVAILFLANMFASIIDAGNVFRFVASPVLAIAGGFLFVLGLRRLVRSFSAGKPQSKSIN